MSYDSTATLIPKILAGFVLGCCLAFIPPVVQSASANSATVQWAANSESDLAGYKVYQGITAGSYGPAIDAGKSTTYIASNLQPGLTYYFAVTAHDTNGNESPPSTEMRTYIEDSSGGGGGSLLRDDFTDGNFTGWQIIDQGTVTAPSAWAVVSGALQQTSNIYGGNTLPTGLPKPGTFGWYANGLGWSNYHLAVQIQSTDNDALGVMVRYQDPNNYYRFSWDASRTYRRLVKVVNGTFTLLEEEPVPYVVGQAYQLDVIADGNTLEVRVDGAPLFGGPVTDNALATGSVALYSWGNQNSIFDNVQVSTVGGGGTQPLTVMKAGTGGGR
jgi:hypothetical protein